MRGQTTIDFAIGVSVFLAVVLFVFTFVPGIVSPFTSVEEDHTVNVDRIADRLASDALGSAGTPYQLDRRCTVTFFATLPEYTGPFTPPLSPSDCNFSGATLADRVGIEPGSAQVLINITGNLSAGDSGSERLCWDRQAGSLLESDDCPSGPTNRHIELATDDGPPSDNAALISATRVVTLAGEDVTLRVVMW